MTYGFGPGPLPMMMAAGGIARRVLVDSTVRSALGSSPGNVTINGVPLGAASGDRVVVLFGTTGGESEQPSVITVVVGEASYPATIDTLRNNDAREWMWIAVAAVPQGTTGALALNTTQASIFGVYACYGVAATPLDSGIVWASNVSTLSVELDVAAGGLLLAYGNTPSGAFSGVMLDASAGQNRLGSAGTAAAGTAGVSITQAYRLQAVSLAPTG